MQGAGRSSRTLVVPARWIVRQGVTMRVSTREGAPPAVHTARKPLCVGARTGCVAPVLDGSATTSPNAGARCG
jgi:hypothetical protein